MPPETWNTTPTRPVRVATDLWEAFGEAAAKMDTDRSTLLREFMRWVIHDNEKPLPAAPTRPAKPTPRRPQPGSPEAAADPTYVARTIKLTAAQAEAIEQAHRNRGRYWATTSTDRGRRQGIRTAEALVEKGIFQVAKEEPGESMFELTKLGRAVYDIHPKVIRR